MAIERFTWATEKGAEGEITQRVRTKKLGDGYTQSVEDGINNRSQSWPVTFTGLKPRIKDIMAFLDRHKGARGFLWEPAPRMTRHWTSAKVVYRPASCASARTTNCPSVDSPPFP